MIALKLVTIGDDLGVVLPQKFVAKLGVGDGDILHASETKHGIELRSNNTELTGQKSDAEALAQWIADHS